MSAIEPDGPAPDHSADLTRVALDPLIEIRTLSTADEMVQAVDVFKQVWGSVTELVRLEMLMAISHSGGYVAGAFDTRGEEEMILGASVGILADHHGARALHSHVTGILPGVRRSGLGRSMKLHQQAWAAGRDIESIVWTFDPLVRRNAWFNIAILGAEVHEYLPSFYGEMTDAINAGDESDRLLVAWSVHTDPDAPLRDGSRIDREEDAVIAIPTPDDIVTLRRTDPNEVQRWRAEVRDAFGSLLADGWRVVGFTSDGEYLLSPI